MTATADIEDELFAIEEGFWSGGEEGRSPLPPGQAGCGLFLAHVDERCLIAFPQMPDFQGVHSREEVAATARQPNRWRGLKISNRSMVQPAEGVAILSYRADVTRADGEPYSALIGSGYVKRGDGWKLCFHQHSVLEQPSRSE